MKIGFKKRKDERRKVAIEEMEKKFKEEKKRLRDEANEKVRLLKKKIIEKL